MFQSERLPHIQIILYLSVKASSGTSSCCGRDEQQVRASLLLSSLAGFAAVLDAGGLALLSAGTAPAFGAAVLVPHPRVLGRPRCLCPAQDALPCCYRLERPPLFRGGVGRSRPPRHVRAHAAATVRRGGGGVCASTRHGRRVHPGPHPRQADRVGVREEGLERARPLPTLATPRGDALAAPRPFGVTADRTGGGTVIPPRCIGTGCTSFGWSAARLSRAVSAFP